MPAADDLFSYVNDDVEPYSAPALEPVNTSPGPTPPGKSKKKKGKKNAASKPKLDDEEETPYVKLAPSSPPAINGIEHEAVHEPELALLQPSLVPSTSPPAGCDEEVTAFVGMDASPAPEYASSSPITSPRLQYAKPCAPASSSLKGDQCYEDVDLRKTLNRNPVRPATHSRERPYVTKPLPRPQLPEPPPPHMAQAHFFNPPSLGFNLDTSDGCGRPAGSDGYCCRFDSFSSAGDLASAKRAKDALLVGCEGGLEVYRVLTDKLEVIGRLEGLRGGVYDAKIIPHTARVDTLQRLRPLVVVTLHGPTEPHQGGQNDYSQGQASWQTSVEVFSLSTQQRLAILYSSLPADPPKLGHGLPPAVPTPIGDLQLDASGPYVTITSGKSGEVFVFSSIASPGDQPDYRCIGKLWTALQTHPARAHSRPSSSSDSADRDRDPYRQKGVPLVSLSARWLAVVPPPSSSNVSIQGTATLSDDANTTPPGVSSHSAPAQPQLSCETVGVDVEGPLSKLTRQAAQGLWKASRMGLELGKQGWREFTNPSPPTNAAHLRASSREHDLFPPTNAPSEEIQGWSREPTLLSVFDLDALLRAHETGAKMVPPPLITFAVPEGCNFVSFSPHGLHILAASETGEVFRIWDLTRAIHGDRNGASTATGQPRAPFARQIQQIHRNSAALPVDCVWTRDGEWVAIMTAHGTVHLHEIVQHATKQRRQRSTVTAPAPEKAEATVSVSQGLSPPSSNGFIGSIRSSWQSVSTQVNTIRTQNPSAGFALPTTFAGFRETATAARNASGRAVARGLSQGFTAAKSGASDLWHADENKIKPRQLAQHARMGCMKWICRRAGNLVAVACAGTIHLYPVQRIERSKGSAVVSGLRYERYGHKGFALPPINTASDSNFKEKKSTDCHGLGPHGFWSLRHAASQEPLPESAAAAKAPLSAAAELETNPPYCPFHVDPRVSMFAFDDGVSEQLRFGRGSGADPTWTFGGPLPPSNKVNEQIYDMSEVDALGNEDDESDSMAQHVESKLTIRSIGDGEQIRIHAKLRQKPRGGSDDRARTMDGDFELLDDDDDSYY